jgi:hypothetical protein
MKTMYAITHQYSPISRTLTFGNDGRNHFDTLEEAEAALELYKGPSGLCKVLTPKQMETLKVIAITCYNHGDSVDTVFEL